MKAILVGYDGTRPAERALSRAAELAKAFGSKVVVVSVATPQPLATPGAFGCPTTATGPKSSARHRAQTRRSSSSIASACRRSSQTPGMGVEFAGVVGQPAEEIVEVAEQQQADLIVVGTREAGLIERLLGGSVSQGVAWRAHCDVLIVHPPSEDEA